MSSHCVRPAFLVSGQGTTIKAVLSEIDRGHLKGVEPRLVIASSPGIPAIKRAIKAGMHKDDVVVIDPKNFATPYDFGGAIIAECKSRKVNLISQSGWLPQTPPVVIQWCPFIINQHAGPLDSMVEGFDFGGKEMFGRRPIAARLHFCQMVGRDFWTEAVSHYVTTKYDRGDIIRSSRVNFLDRNETVASIQKRLLPIEHHNTTEVLRYFTFGFEKVPSVVYPKHWLVKPDEKEILEECKWQAIADYPDG